MKRVFIIVGVVIVVLVGAFIAINSSPVTEENEPNVIVKEEEKPKLAYQKIAADQAMNIMNNDEKYILLDVRTEEEFAEAHIKGAVLVPDSEIGERIETEVSDKDALIMVYCRSGVRSSKAASELAEMGYTNVYDIGGIIDWPYEIVSEN